jgi:hypothetical protein
MLKNFCKVAVLLTVLLMPCLAAHPEDLDEHSGNNI